MGVGLGFYGSLPHTRAAPYFSFFFWPAAPTGTPPGYGVLSNKLPQAAVP